MNPIDSKLFQNIPENEKSILLHIHNEADLIQFISTMFKEKNYTGVILPVGPVKAKHASFDDLNTFYTTGDKSVLQNLPDVSKSTRVKRIRVAKNKQTKYTQPKKTSLPRRKNGVKPTPLNGTNGVYQRKNVKITDATLEILKMNLPLSNHLPQLEKNLNTESSENNLMKIGLAYTLYEIYCGETHINGIKIDKLSFNQAFCQPNQNFITTHTSQNDLAIDK